MHLVVINGSPRLKSISNSKLIIDSFLEGFCNSDNTYELFNISNKTIWKNAKASIYSNFNIIIVLPLYAESIPSILLEFLETLADIPFDEKRQISFMLHSGFMEACQRRCCETLLKRIPEHIGGVFAGTLSKGNTFPLWLCTQEKLKDLLADFKKMGAYYSENRNFFGKQVEEKNDAEYISESEAKIVNRIIKFALYDFAEKFDTKTDLMFAPYDQ